MKNWITGLAILCAVPALSSAGVRDDLLAVADAVALTGQVGAAAEIEAIVGSASDAELELVYGQTDLAAFENFFVVASGTLDAVDAANAPGSAPTRETLQSFSASGLGVGADLPRPFSAIPGAVGYPGGICPFSPDRSNADDLLIAVDAIQVARVALEIARGAWSVSDRACNTVAVVAGFGGNPQSPLCVATDIIMFAAEAAVGVAQAAVDHIAYCDGAVDSAEIEGSYERAGHIHSDLETHDSDISSQLATHDADLKAQLATHDADIKALLGDIQDTVDENQRLIKISMSRQLEMMRLLITPEGQREINPEVLSCEGDDCPQELVCPKGGLAFPCK